MFMLLFYRYMLVSDIIANNQNKLTKAQRVLFWLSYKSKDVVGIFGWLSRYQRRHRFLQSHKWSIVESGSNRNCNVFAVAANKGSKELAGTMLIRENFWAVVGCWLMLKGES